MVIKVMQQSTFGNICAITISYFSVFDVLIRH